MELLGRSAGEHKMRNEKSEKEREQCSSRSIFSVNTMNRCKNIIIIIDSAAHTHKKNHNSKLMPCSISDVLQDKWICNGHCIVFMKPIQCNYENDDDNNSSIQIFH